MDDCFKIFVERLRDDGPETLEESLAPDFMQIEEEELAFEHPVQLSGLATVIDDALVISVSLSTKAKLPCSICNELCEVDLEIGRFEHTESVDEVKSGVYNMAPVLREALLLELPAKAECHGACPDRERIKKYLSKGDQNFPFQNLGEE
ncbi:MAG: hypothetical protein S4CHLAM81_07690 [Chlamydiales bacterium]|nr:hypothetical protein [Chlamydiales bacterium]MCH9635551.1 hypothetical protein [Chlamydiales bacterium]MCH9703900.1 DUF177 domain-containing protein [Chlamydiota bacterium]